VTKILPVKVTVCQDNGVYNERWLEGIWEWSERNESESERGLERVGTNSSDRPV